MAYTVTFKNIKDQTCVVTIGCSATGTLAPAAVPFETQEEAPDSIFDTIVGQSGYIRVIDEGQNVLENLIPSSVTSYPVTLTVAGAVKWKGYISPEVFTQEWGAPTSVVPAEIEIPIISPLMALSYIDYPGNTNGYGVDNTQIGSILYLIMTQVYASSDKVMFPYIEDNDMMQSGYYYGGLLAYIYNHNFAEWNDDEDRWDFQTCTDVLDTISKYFGWQWREWEGMLILTASDLETGSWNTVTTVAGLISPSTSEQPSKTSGTLVSTLNWDGAGHSMSILQGRRNLKITSNINIGEDAIELPNFRKKLTCLSLGDPAVDESGTFGISGYDDTACYVGWKGNDYIKLTQYSQTGVRRGAQATGNVFKSALLHNYLTSRPDEYAGGSLSTVAYFQKDSTTTSSPSDVINLSSYAESNSNKDKPAVELISRFNVYNLASAYLKVSANVQYFSEMCQMTKESVDNKEWHMQIYVQNGSTTYYVGQNASSYAYYWDNTASHEISVKIRDGNITRYQEPTTGAFAGFNLADGFYIQMGYNNTPITGTLHVVLYTPHEDNKVYELTNLKIEVLQRGTLEYTNKVIDDEAYDYEYRSESTDNLYLDDLSETIDMATDRGRGNGRGVVRNNIGEPISACYNEGQTGYIEEEYLLERYKNWYGDNRRELQVEVEYMSTMNPMARLTHNSRTYMPFSHHIDWQANKDVMELIEL